MVSTTSALLALCFVLNLLHISVAESLDAAHGSCKQLLQRKEWYGSIQHLVLPVSSFIVIGGL